MKTSKLTRNRFVENRKAALLGIARIGPFMEGSLCSVKRAGCAEPGWQLTWKKAGKTHTVYVPMELVPEVKAWTREYKKLKKHIRKVTGQSLAIVRRYVANRRAASRTPQPSRKPSHER